MIAVETRVPHKSGGKFIGARERDCSTNSGDSYTRGGNTCQEPAISIFHGEHALRGGEGWKSSRETREIPRQVRPGWHS